MTDAQAERLCQMFAEGLESGLGYARIFEMMKRSGTRETVVNRLRSAILDDGNQLGEAFTRYGILDPVARKLILVAEEQGKLPETFEQLAGLYESRYSRKKRLIFAMVEPIVLIALGVFVLGELVSTRLIEIATAENSMKAALDALVAAGINVGMFLGATFGALYTWLNLPVNMMARDMAARIWMRLPVISKSSRTRSVAMFCRYLEQSVSTGFDVHRGLGLAADASNNPKLQSQIDSAEEEIQQGASLADALFAVPMLPDEVIEQVKIGEESGRLAERLDFLADRFNERADEQFDKMMSVLIWLLRYSIIIFVVGSFLWSVTQMEVF